MLQHEAALEQIKRTRLVAILRGIGSGQALDIASALYEGGVRALEFTFDHDDPDCVAHNCERIHAVRSRFPEDLLVGCGTALTVEEVEKSIAAGGQLVISPNTNVEVIRPHAGTGRGFHARRFDPYGNCYCLRSGSRPG